MGKKKKEQNKGNVSPKQKIQANALNELDATGDEAEAIPEMKPSSALRIVVATVTSLVQCALGAGGASFLLFFDGFIMSVWASLYASTLAHAASLFLCGFTGLAALVIRRKVVPSRLYVIFGLILLATAATSSTFLIQGFLNNESEVSETWSSRVSTDAASQSYLCDVERILRCTGWSAPCIVRSPDEMMRHLVFGDGSSWSSLSNNTNCPICANGPSQNYTQTCQSAIHEVTEYTVWVGVPANAVLVVSTFFNAVFFHRRLRELREEERSQLISEGMQYL